VCLYTDTVLGPDAAVAYTLGSSAICPDICSGDNGLPMLKLAGGGAGLDGCVERTLVNRI
jgi:hypothetical protein